MKDKFLLNYCFIIMSKTTKINVHKDSISIFVKNGKKRREGNAARYTNARHFAHEMDHVALKMGTSVGIAPAPRLFSLVSSTDHFHVLNVMVWGKEFHKYVVVIGLCRHSFSNTVLQKIR